MAARKPRIKVYGGNLGGTHRCILATNSIRAFCAATGIGRDWVSETGNAEECQVALAEPGQAFIQPFKRLDGDLPWRKWAKGEHWSGKR